VLDYYLKLSWVSVRRNRVLVALIIGAIGIGVGAFITTYNLYHVASGNPIPGKSSQLHYVRLDNAGPSSPPDFHGMPDNIPPHVTWRDARGLYAQAPAPRQAASMPTAVAVDSGDGNFRPTRVMGRHSTPELFAMFDIPFLHGGAWTAGDEENRAQVVVLTRSLNERVFGDEDSVGRQILLNDRPFRVVGVMDRWQPVPRFYDVLNGIYADVEDVWIPFSLIEPLESVPSGGIDCPIEPPAGGHRSFLLSECRYATLWAELPDHAALQEYSSFVAAYIDEERRQGRFEKPDAGFAVDDVMTWLATFDVVGQDAPVYVLAAGLFLLVCLVNTVGLLLAKFLSRSTELGVRRALGATRGDLFLQHLMECLLIGVLGGALGLALAWLGLRGMGALFERTARLAAMDPAMVAFALAVAMVASVLAGVYPAWRAALASPAHQIRNN
jgi:putative ABC transport system permease protein